MKKINRKRISYIAILLLGIGLLSACGSREDETAYEQRTFRMDAMQGVPVESETSVACSVDASWTIAGEENNVLYYKAVNDPNSKENTSYETDWEQNEGETLLNLYERGDTLYAQVLTENGAMEIRKYMGIWKTLTVVIDTETAWKEAGNGMYVDTQETAYHFGEHAVTHLTADGQTECTYEVDKTPCFVFENAEGQLCCMACDGTNLYCYELKEEEAVLKWQMASTAERVYFIQSDETGVLCLAAEDGLWFVDEQRGSLTAKTTYAQLGIWDVWTGSYNQAEKTLLLYGHVNEEGQLYEMQLSDTTDDERIELVYGTYGRYNSSVTPIVQSAILEFNQTNEDYYITIKNYRTDESYEREHERLHAEMAAGDAPDILDMEIPSWYETDAESGFLEDLTPYLKQSEYSEDLMWNVLDAFEVNGGIYLLPTEFQIEGLVMHEEDMEGITEWNMAAFGELIEKNQWEKIIIDAGETGDPETLLNVLLTVRQEEFIDWENQTVSFASEEFEELLTLCKEYTENQTQDTSDWHTSTEWSTQTICKAWYCGHYTEYLSYVYDYGREYSIYGYPTASGETYLVDTCFTSCAIYAGSKHKEGAWEFLELLLSDKYQNWSEGWTVNRGFPIRKSMLEEQAEESLQEEIGINNWEGTITESEIEIVNEVLNQEKFTRNNLNQNIQQIVEEEAESYFYGDRSAAEAAEAIQKRAWIVLSE